jgi:hypothetical protein
MRHSHPLRTNGQSRLQIKFRLQVDTGAPCRCVVAVSRDYRFSSTITPADAKAGGVTAALARVGRAQIQDGAAHN